MFVQALWSHNPQEPQKLLQGRVKGTIKVLSGLLPVHTQAKLIYSFSSFHNDTINKAKKFLFSSNPLYYVALFAASRNWCSLHCRLPVRAVSCLTPEPEGPWGTGKSLPGESPKQEKGTHKCKERRIWKGDVRIYQTDSQEKQKQPTPSCCTVEPSRSCFCLAKIKTKSTHMCHTVSCACLSNHTQNKRQLSIPRERAGEDRHNCVVTSAAVVSVSAHQDKTWSDSLRHGSWLIEDASRHQQLCTFIWFLGITQIHICCKKNEWSNTPRPCSHQLPLVITMLLCKKIRVWACRE